jgi:hypothetical protein
MLEEFQKLLSIQISNARRLRAIAKETNVDVKIKAMNDKCKIQRLLQKDTIKKFSKRVKIECSKVLTTDTNKRVKIKEKSNECKIEVINIFYKEKYVKFLFYC